MAFVKRVTQETNIQLALDLDGGSVSVRESILGKEYASGDGQTIHVHTGVGFLDHMLTALAKHGGCLLYTSPSPRDGATSRMPSSA